MYTEMQIFIHMSHSKKILNVGNYGVVMEHVKSLLHAGLIGTACDAF